MRFDTLNNQSTRRRAAGFTLIEMLIVIVIIAILVAILFPVFKTVKETSRQATSIANLHVIQQALKQYQQDHDGYSPPVLFGYVVTGASMKSAYGTAESNGTAAQYFPGLYPTYVKDYTVFEDPDNSSASDTSPSSVVTGAGYYTLNATGQRTKQLGDFYAADAYDLSLELASTTGLSTSQYDVWYETAWTDLSAINPKYPELITANPLGSTFVTATTYHVPSNGNVLVLFEDGSVHTVTASSFYGAQGAPYQIPEN